MGRTAGAVLLLVAAAVMVMQVEVRGVVAGGPARGCGSAWEVVAGRAGWQDWLAADIGSAAGEGSTTTLTRTQRCPSAVNRRILGAATLALAAVAAASLGELMARRRGTAAPSAGEAGRIRRFGLVSMILGIVLTAGGLAGLALLVADPDDALFLYVSRTVVVLAGLLLVLPALLLVALGRAATLAADHLQRRGPDT